MKILHRFLTAVRMWAIRWSERLPSSWSEIGPTTLKLRPVPLFALVIAIPAVLALGVAVIHPPWGPDFMAALSALMTASAAAGVWITIVEVQRERLERSTPSIHFYPELQSGNVTFVLRNGGPGIARNVAVGFEPEPIMAGGLPLGASAAFAAPIATLSPHETIRVFYHFVGQQLFSDDVRRHFVARLSYTSEAGHPIATQVEINLDVYRDALLPEPTVEKSLATIARVLDTRRLVDG